MENNKCEAASGCYAQIVESLEKLIPGIPKDVTYIMCPNNDELMHEIRKVCDKYANHVMLIPDSVDMHMMYKRIMEYGENNFMNTVDFLDQEMGVLLTRDQLIMTYMAKNAANIASVRDKLNSDKTRHDDKPVLEKSYIVNMKKYAMYKFILEHWDHYEKLCQKVESGCGISYAQISIDDKSVQESVSPQQRNMYSVSVVTSILY